MFTYVCAHTYLYFGYLLIYKTVKTTKLLEIIIFISYLSHFQWFRNSVDQLKGSAGQCKLRVSQAYSQMLFEAGAEN